MAYDEKKPQVLELTPPTELVFKGPFNRVVTSKLILKNPINDRVYFRIKTTAPRQYCVSPNRGVIDPLDTAEIEVMLQPFDQSTTHTIIHKFMVQSLLAPPSSRLEDLDIIWRNSPKNQIMDSKLRCVFIEGVAEPS